MLELRIFTVLLNGLSRMVRRRKNGPELEFAVSLRKLLYKNAVICLNLWKCSRIVVTFVSIVARKQCDHAACSSSN